MFFFKNKEIDQEIKNGVDRKPLEEAGYPKDIIDAWVRATKYDYIDLKNKVNEKVIFEAHKNGFAGYKVVEFSENSEALKNCLTTLDTMVLQEIRGERSDDLKYRSKVLAMTEEGDEILPNVFFYIKGSRDGDSLVMRDGQQVSWQEVKDVLLSERTLMFRPDRWKSRAKTCELNMDVTDTVYWNNYEKDDQEMERIMGDLSQDYIVTSPYIGKQKVDRKQTDNVLKLYIANDYGYKNDIVFAEYSAKGIYKRGEWYHTEVNLHTGEIMLITSSVGRTKVRALQNWNEIAKSARAFAFNFNDIPLLVLKLVLFGEEPYATIYSVEGEYEASGQEEGELVKFLKNAIQRILEKNNSK